jgi:hypothetical protein
MMQKPGNRGISMIIDLSFAVFIFLLISWSLTTVWSNKSALLQRQLYEDETSLLAERVLDTLVTSTGYPSDWEDKLIHDLEVVGLAKRDRVLDENKVNRFVNLARDQSIRTGLAGFWAFDGSAQDSSGNGNHGTVNGATPTTGHFGQVYDFDGTDDYIDVAHSGSLDIANEITIAGWVNPDDVTNPVRLVAKRSQADVGGYVLESSTSVINPGDSFVMWLDIGGTWEEVPSTTEAVQASWFHVAGTYDGTQMKIYVNGILENNVDQAGAIDSINAPLAIGAIDAEAPLAPNFFDGAIDEPVVFDRALSKSEVQSIMLNGVFWDLGTVKQKLLIGANEYYFRLIDPSTGNVVKNRDGEYLKAGQQPDSTWLQAVVKRPVVFPYRRQGETQVEDHEAIAELTLYLPYRTW